MKITNPKDLELYTRIEDLVGEAYEIGHAHGMAPMQFFLGKKAIRLDEGWQPIADKIFNMFKKSDEHNSHS
jgi:hypothetical protein